LKTHLSVPKLNDLRSRWAALGINNVDIPEALQFQPPRLVLVLESSEGPIIESVSSTSDYEQERVPVLL
jgi:hypothetical protein